MDPIMMKKFFKESQKIGLHEYAFISEEATFTYDYPQIHYKRVPKEYFNPTTITAFGDHVAFHLWDPLSFILINNKSLADSYKKHFKILWDNPVTTLTGDDAVKRVFTQMSEKLKTGEEYTCFGASNESKRFLPLFIDIMKKINKKNVNSRVIFDEDTIDQIQNLIIYKGRAKTLPKEFITPMEVNMYHDTTFFVVFSKNPIVMIIENKEITDSFRKYFEVMWEIAK
ncbi:MAG: hypothetical protein QF632_00015 [Candidatus Woesearchaeota archaeon]|jgi:hypothetical protein|nr:hypothetical protein [Candidatus Woesearchaeota archaeon]MDP7323126.1 hypothetical protein [Candidatus Woesearchaeota archaeon]